jgi:hypothetical protein
MYDENQTVIPRPFIELFIPQGASKPTEPRAVIAERYELCEDMAQMLSEPALEKQAETGDATRRVLLQIHQGLLADPAVVTRDEAGWVTCRLAELLGWPIPDWS